MEIRTADWKHEKHVPVIHVNGNEITVQVGEEVPHPNTLEHHIKWIQLYLDGVLVGQANFSAHGEKGILTEPVAVFKLSRAKGKLTALALCNIHGLWESSQDL